MKDRLKLVEKIRALDIQKLEPNRSEEDVDRMNAKVRQLERERNECKERVENILKERNDTN